MTDTKYLAYYTCFYGDDNNVAFRIPPIPSYQYNCYFYSNNYNLLNKLKNTYWIGIYDNLPISEDINISTMQGKRIKTNPQLYDKIKDYKYLCFLDSKFDKLNEKLILNKIDEYFIKQNYALLLRQHHFVGNNIWDEFNMSMYQERYVKEEKQIRKYINSQFKKGLKEITDSHSQCNLLIRNMKHDKIININETWLKHIEKCGIQDQISFFFVKQIFNKYILNSTDDFFYKNLVIITSVIKTLKKSLSCSDKNIYKQTLNTIDSVRKYYNNPYIVIIEGSNISELLENEIKSKVDYYYNISNKKNIDESYLLLNYLLSDHFNENKINFFSITKLSERYYFTEKIINIYDYFDNIKYKKYDKLIFKNNNDISVLTKWYCIHNSIIKDYIYFLKNGIIDETDIEEYTKNNYLNKKKYIGLSDIEGLEKNI